MLVANPAQLPYGGKIWRWVGSKTSVVADPKSLSAAKELKSAQSGADSSKLVDTIFSTPMHGGASESLSVLTNNVGLALLTRGEADIRGWKTGDPDTGSGTPEIVATPDLLAGAYLSAAARSSLDWLSFGVSAKYLALNLVPAIVDITSQQALAGLPKALTKSLGPSALERGFGMDVGSLIFFQGKNLDFRLGATVVNLGGLAGMSAQGSAALQTANVGGALTFHTEGDAIHLAVDYRDATDVAKEPIFRRIYMGTKVLIQTYVGLAAGLYHGSPSYGVELDLLILRLALTSYTPEYGGAPGVDPRPIQMLSLALGWGF